MTELKNFQEVNAVLANFAPPPLTSGAALILDRMTTLLEYLGNPERQFKVIHVAGTSGKTSTCYYVASLLRASGKKVGHTVSPHVQEVNERVQINCQPLPEAQFTQELSAFLDIIANAPVKPTYFELLIAFALWVFGKNQVEYVVLEVGLGGLLDATNAVEDPNKIAVITDIGFDHMHILGHTLGDIAGQKAGIIKPGNHVFMFTQGAEVMQVVQGIVQHQGATLHEIEFQAEATLPLPLPKFQRRNLQLSKAVFNYLAERDQLSPLDEAHEHQAASIVIPGRMETLHIGNKIIILDGAHNAQKIAALAESIRETYPKLSIATLTAFAETKDFKEPLETLAHLSQFVVLTSFSIFQGMARASAKPGELAHHFHSQNINHFEVIPDPQVAFSMLMNRHEDIILVTGSFFLLNHIRPLLYK